MNNGIRSIATANRDTAAAAAELLAQLNGMQPAVIVFFASHQHDGSALALRMKQVARLNGVTIGENKPLARELFKRVDMERAVPEDLFPVVARILAWGYLRRERPGAEAV